LKLGNSELHIAERTSPNPHQSNHSL
jgi:hypothetical protein